MKRKIASNYIYLPNSHLIKYGYVEVERGHVLDVVDFGGEMQEKPGIEFYGGMLIAGNVEICKEGRSILAYLDGIYGQVNFVCKGLALIENADLKQLNFLPQSNIRKILF